MSKPFQELRDKMSPERRAMNAKRAAVIRAVNDSNGELKPNDVIAVLGDDDGSTRRVIETLIDEGVIYVDTDLTLVFRHEVPCSECTCSNYSAFPRCNECIECKIWSDGCEACAKDELTP